MPSTSDTEESSSDHLRRINLSNGVRIQFRQVRCSPSSAATLALALGDTEGQFQPSVSREAACRPEGQGRLTSGTKPRIRAIFDESAIAVRAVRPDHAVSYRDRKRV